jgi:ribosome biogenesis GTPase / thiamine phosphate phosphatase
MQHDQHPLARLGWDDQWGAALEEVADEPGLVAARIAAEHRGGYELLTALGATTGVAAGRLREGERPVAGDWVAARPLAGEDRSVIRALLPRRTAVRRKAPGEETVDQVVAANVDVVACVVSADDVNARRLERYLSVAWDSGAVPLVVVTKADLGDAAEVEQVAVGVDVVRTSAQEGWGLDGVLAHLPEGRTGVLIGPSGTGKSTLVNALLGEERMATGEIRQADGRGRHTTTHRQLLAVPGGGVVIDTPGLREVGIWDAEGVERVFGDVVEAAERCRFGDCSHEVEPGCAVREEIDPERLEAWRKLEREAAWLERRRDARAAEEERRRWRAIQMEHRRNPSPKR